MVIKRKLRNLVLILNIIINFFDYLNGRTQSLTAFIFNTN
jgi:hypothetical protein